MVGRIEPVGTTFQSSTAERKANSPSATSANGRSQCRQNAARRDEEWFGAGVVIIGGLARGGADRMSDRLFDERVWTFQQGGRETRHGACRHKSLRASCCAI